MPRSRGRQGLKGGPNQSTVPPLHSSQTTIEKRYDKIARLLGASLRKILEWPWKRKSDLLLWSSVVMTLLAGAFFFLPRVTVEPSGPYDPSNPSPITFTISNINIIPLRNVQPAIGLCFIDTEDRPHFQCSGPSRTKLSYVPWLVRWLDVDEKYQIALEDAIRASRGSAQFQRANITISVTYTPWWMPWFWRNTVEFRFVTKKRSDGKIYWIPTPLNQ